MTDRKQRVLDCLAEAVGVIVRVIGFGLQLVFEGLFNWW